MFNIGFSELLILGVIGLLVLGPEQLPEVARKLAKIFNDLKRAKDEIMSPVEDLKAQAHRMIEQARVSAAHKELEDLLKKIDPQGMANDLANYDPLKPLDPLQQPTPIPPHAAAAEPHQQEFPLDTAGPAPTSSEPTPIPNPDKKDV